MRYLTIIKATKEFEAGETASQKLQDLMGAYVGEAMQKGIFVDGAGLLPSRHATRFSLRGTTITSFEGPFDVNEGLISGYAVIEVPDEEAARQVMRDFLEVHIKGDVDFLDIELRPLEAME